MTKLPDNLISEIGKIGYDIEGWTSKNHLSSVKSIDMEYLKQNFISI